MSDPFVKFKAATEAFDREFVELRQAVANATLSARDEKLLPIDAWEFNWLVRVVVRAQVDEKIAYDATRGVEAVNHAQSLKRLQEFAKKLEALDKP